jgi:hypothetical protein
VRQILFVICRKNTCDSDYYVIYNTRTEKQVAVLPPSPITVMVLSIMPKIVESTVKSLPEHDLPPGKPYQALPQQHLPPIAQPRPAAKRRLEDQLTEAYVKIGGIIGVTLALGVFVLVCTVSYNVFFRVPHGMLFIFSAGLATLVGAGSLAICTFLSSSVLWLPICILLAASSSAILPMLQWLMQAHH